MKRHLHFYQWLLCLLLTMGSHLFAFSQEKTFFDDDLQSGDVILKIDDQDITTADSYTEAVLGLTLKETYSVVFMREGSNGYKELTCDIEAGILK